MSGKGVNEMKKFLTVLLASVLIASMSSLVVCAAGSSSVSGNRVEEKVEEADKDQQRIDEEKDLPVSTFDNATVPQDFKNVGSIDYNLSAITTTEGFVEAVKKIEKVEVFKNFLHFYSDAPFAFSEESIKAMEGKEVEYWFKHNGHMYEVYLGSRLDLSKTPITYDGNNKYMGPLELARQVGGSVKMIR